MEKEAFEKRLENLEEAFYELDPEALIPDNIVQEIDELLQVSPDNLTLLNLKALILMSDNFNNSNKDKEIVSVYEHILKLVPQKSQEAKDAKEMINLYNSHTDCNISKNTNDTSFICRVSPYFIFAFKIVVLSLILFYIFTLAKYFD